MRRNQITLIHFNAGRWPLLLVFLSRSTLPLILSPLCLPLHLFLSIFCLCLSSCLPSSHLSAGWYCTGSRAVRRRSH